MLIDLIKLFILWFFPPLHSNVLTWLFRRHAKAIGDETRLRVAEDAYTMTFYIFLCNLHLVPFGTKATLLKCNFLSFCCLLYCCTNLWDWIWTNIRVEHLQFILSDYLPNVGTTYVYVYRYRIYFQILHCTLTNEPYIAETWLKQVTDLLICFILWVGLVDVLKSFIWHDRYLNCCSP